MTQRGVPASVHAGFREAVKHYRRGDAASALEQCERLLSAAPAGEALAACLNLKAVILAQRGCLFSASDCLRQAIEANPQDARLHDHAARVDAALGRWVQAGEHAAAACGLEPGNLAFRYQFARILRFGGDLVGAEREAAACLAAEPGFSEAGLLLSELATEQDDPERAIACLRRIVEQDPDHVRAWALLAEANPDRLGDLPVEASLRRLAEASREPEDVATAQFALAASALRRGDHAGAFALFRAANDARAAQSPFAVHAWTQRVDSILAAPPVPHGPESAAQRSRGGGPDADPGARLVFVVGMPRSGTTLCEQVLSAHPRVFGAGERRAMEPIEAELAHRGIDPLAPDVGSSVLDALRGAYLQGLPPQSAGHELVIDKAPRNFERVGLVLRLFPAARIVWMLRHPLDTILSCYLQDFRTGQAFSNRLEHAARVYADHARLLRHWTGRQAKSILVVDYADLVLDLEDTTRRMAAFLGLEFDAAMLRPDLNPRRVHTASAEQVRQPVHAQSLDRWRQFVPELAGIRGWLEQQDLLAADGTSRVHAWLTG